MKSIGTKSCDEVLRARDAALQDEIQERELAGAALINS